MTQTLTTKQLNAIAAGEFDACSVLDASVSMARELLANREAQPVAEVIEVGDALLVEWYRNLEEGAKLYTAPPAPAVNLTPDFEAWFNSPEAGLRVVNFHIQHELQLKSWNACCAAMLAQPVSGGYTLPDDTRRMDWLVSHYVAVRQPLVYGSHAMFTAQQVSDDHEEHKTDLREQIDAAMLAAAPESGNG